MYPLYETYKKGTAKIVEYLHSMGTNKTADAPPNRIPVRRILELARELAMKAVKPPKYIRDAFNVALINRRKITDYYERTQQESQNATVESTKRHKFFNETLAYAYDVLFPSLPPPSRRAAKKAKAAARISGASSSSSESDCASTNRFEVLSDMIEQESAFEGFAFDNIESEQGPTTKLSAIEDDPIETAIALHLYLAEVEDVISVCKSYWKNHAQGNVSLPLAGWVTMLGQELIRHVADAQDVKFGGYERMIYEYISAKATSAREQGPVETAQQFPLHLADPSYDFHELTQDSGIMWPVEALRNSWNGEGMFDACEQYDSGSEKQKTLFGYFGTREEKEKREEITHRVLACVTPTNGVPMTKDTAFTGVDVLRLKHRGDMNRVEYLLRDMFKTSCEPRQSVQPNHAVPLHNEIWQFLRCPDQSIPSSLVFGLHLFSETSMSYLWSTPTPSSFTKPTNLWYQALLFGRQAGDVVDECRNLIKYDDTYDGLFTETILEEWDRRVRVLDGFLLRDRYDLYHQSPWVAGANMSGILATMQHFGLGLLNQAGVFGSLLHLYNMLRVVDVACPEIPVLEKLGDIFSSQVFMDKKRPTSRFATMLDVFLGAELVHRSGRTILVPAKHDKGRDAAFAPNARIKPENMCLFTHQLGFDGICGDMLWDRIADQLVTKQGEEKGKKMKIRRGPGLKERLLQQFDLAEVLSVAGDVVGDEFKGEREYSHPLCLFLLRAFGSFVHMNSRLIRPTNPTVPIATLNAFKLLTLCLHTWSAITQKFEQNQSSKYDISFTLRNNAQHWGRKGSMAIGMALHAQTARDVDDGRVRRGVGSGNGVLELMKDAVVGVWSNVRAEEVQWSGLGGKVVWSA